MTDYGIYFLMKSKLMIFWATCWPLADRPWSKSWNALFSLNCAKKLCPPYLSKGFSNQVEIFCDVLGPQNLALINFWAKSDKFLMGTSYKPYKKKWQFLLFMLKLWIFLTHLKIFSVISLTFYKWLNIHYYLCKIWGSSEELWLFGSRFYETNANSKCKSKRMYILINFFDLKNCNKFCFVSFLLGHV